MKVDYTTRELKQICQKGDKEISFLSIYYYRKFTIYFTKLFLAVDMSPNMVSFLSFLGAFSACWLVLLNKPIAYIAAAIGIFTYAAFDRCDGEVARFWIHEGIGKLTFNGAYADYIIHYYTTNLLLFFFGLSVYFQYGYLIYIFLGFFACIGLSNFPNHCAVYIMHLRHKLTDNEFNYKIFPQNELYGNEKEIALILNGTRSQKLKKLFLEFCSFPGLLDILYICLIVDAILLWTGIEVYSMRLVMVPFYSALYIIVPLRKIHHWMHKFNV